MRKRFLILVGLLALISTPASPAANTADAILRGDTAKGFSGAVLIGDHDRVLLDKGYGIGGGQQVRPNSRFWIASAGKQFVSAAILKCAERRWLTLDDPLARFFPDTPADKRAITIRQLLAHLSGLDQTYASEGAKSRDEAVQRMLSKPLADKPGNKFHYSNDNYELAAAIVEVASGRDYRDFVRSDLWRPAGLRDTGFNSMPGAAQVLPASQALPPRFKEMKRGEAGVYSTTHDLLTWYRALRSGRVLSRADVQVLLSPVTPIGEGQAALGWFLGKTDAGTPTIFTRGNEDFGPNSLLYAYPSKGIVIVVLTHAGNADPNISWSRQVLDQLEKVLNL